tara:strand:- start:321 stop:530 length:210 start_codon:yes stop_codon:yes gene_type:complete
MKRISDELIDSLASKVKNSNTKKVVQIEQVCWTIVHQYLHGVPPTEYDIREIDEELYLAVLAKVKNQSN